MSARRVLTAVLLAALARGGAAASQIAEPSPEAGTALADAELNLEFNHHVLADLGLQLVFRRPAARAGEMVRAVFPAASGSTLALRAPGGSFEAFTGGTLRFESGFEMLWPGGRLSLLEFDLAPGRPPALFELRGRDGSAPLVLDSPHPKHLAEAGEFQFLNMDLKISESFAVRLGEPRLKGAALGSAAVRARLAVPLPRGVDCVADLTGDVDVQLTGISSMVEAFHDSQRVAMAPAVDLHNLGPADVEWYRPIEPDGGGGAAGPHPFLTMSLYRLADGVLQQIGRGDVKHAFFAANSSCDCNGAQILFAGCSDLYSAITNYNRVNLAPRHEVTASAGGWQSQGSHFDGSPVDDMRDHFGEGADHPDPFEHRLSAAAADLLSAGAQYFIEAWYVVAGDIDIFNSMGRRAVAPNFDLLWTFPFADAGVTSGPAVDEWVDPAAPGPGQAATRLGPAVTGEGHLELVASTVALPGGVYRYDYGLMNFDFDRQLRSLAVPLPPGVELASISFTDSDDDAANDWQSVVGASEIVWSTTAGDPELGALDWGSMLNFRFDANAAPADPQAVLGVLEAGGPTQLMAATKGPAAALVDVSRLDVTAAGSGSGTVTSTPAGIGCGGDCDELYAPATAVELTAAADAGSALIRWTEAGVPLGTAATQGTLLDMDRSLVAVFELCDRELGERTVLGPETFEACAVLTAGAGFEVADGGHAVLRAGSGIVLDDGFRVEAGGEATFEIDPGLLP